MLDLCPPLRQSATDGGGSSDSNCSRRFCPDRKICGVIPDIVESALAKFPYKTFGFCIAGEVFFFVRCKPAREKTNVICHRLDQTLITCRSKINRPPLTLCLLYSLNHSLVIGKNRGIKRGGLGQAVLEGGLPLKKGHAE